MHVYNLYLAIFLAIVALILSVLPVYLKRENIVYCLVLTWFFFPNWATNIAGIFHVPVFSYLQFLQSMLLIPVLYKSYRERKEISLLHDKTELYANCFYSLTFIVQYTIGMLFILWIYHFTIVFTWPSFFIGFADGLARLVFLFACYLYIADFEKLKKLFSLIVGCSSILIIEFTLMEILFWKGSLLASYDFDYYGFFISLFLTDPVAAQLFLSLSAVMALYFYFQNKKRCYLIIFIIVLGILAFEMSRSILLATMVGASLFIFLQLRSYFASVLRKMMTILFVLVICNSAVFVYYHWPVNHYFPGNSKNLMGRQVNQEQSTQKRKLHTEVVEKMPANSSSDNTYASKEKMVNDQSARLIDPRVYQEQLIKRKISHTDFIIRKLNNYNSLDSAYIRIGQAMRGLQVLQTTFPFGVGQQTEQYYMPYPAPAYWDEVVIPLFQHKPQIYDGYRRVTVGNIFTEIQVGFISFIVSYGLLGLGSLLLFSGLTMRNLAWALKMAVGNEDRLRLVALIISLLAIYFIYFLFNTSPVIYVIFLALYHATFLLIRPKDNVIEWKK